MVASEACHQIMEASKVCHQAMVASELCLQIMAASEIYHQAVIVSEVCYQAMVASEFVNKQWCRISNFWNAIEDDCRKNFKCHNNIDIGL